MKAELVSHYLTDTDVACFARQSFGKLASNFSDAENANLIRFLARGMASSDWDLLIKSSMPQTYLQGPEEAHQLAVYLRSIPEHWVPFGHPHISLRVTAPIPIRVQCFKHKIGFVESEESRRYISTTPEVYVPPYLREKAKNVKQGSGDTHTHNDHWLQQYKFVTHQAVALYTSMIADGVCPEQARFVLPQGCEVNWVWTGSLYAFANFFNQRTDSHAQKEIQDLARQIGDIIEPLFPVSWGALTAGKY